MKAYVDPDICSGTGICVQICPQVFELSNKGYAVAKVDPVPEDLHDAVQEAKDSCPTGAITVSD